MHAANVLRGTRRATVVAALLALALALVFSAGGATAAHAASSEFCTGFRAGPAGGGSARCHEPTFRKITQVTVTASSFIACASALTGGGALSGGLVCTGSFGGGATNPNYNGAVFLQGLVSNEAGVGQTLNGNELYVP